MNNFRRRISSSDDDLKTDIYVMDANGNEIDVAQATSSCIGVVVRNADKGVAFLIPKVTSYDTDMYWNNDTRTIVPKVTTTTLENIASADYKGVANSNAMRSFDSSVSYAAGFLFDNMIVIGGEPKFGYLGSCGEWYLAYQNKSAINEALSKIGSVKLKNLYYWTSTLASTTNAWAVSWNTGDINSTWKNDYETVRPFYDLR